MLDLLDYRRQVGELYALIRQRHTDDVAHTYFRAVRDDLFRQHPQSALHEGQKARFSGLRYYGYDPAFRVLGTIDENVPQDTIEVDVGDDGLIRYKRIGRVHFELPTGSGSLSLFWIEGYGGGIFLPFGDATNKRTTYGAGRYLYDTIKGADLGVEAGKLVLDFNYAYNPSCAYNYRWVCPLAPRENVLDFEVPAGEKVLEI